MLWVRVTLFIINTHKKEFEKGERELTKKLGTQTSQAERFAVQLPVQLQSQPGD